MSRTMDFFTQLPLLMTLLSLLSTCKQPEEAVIRYADGSGNRYTVANLRIDYAPVSAAMSSSGVYNGGDPQSAVVSRSQVQTLIRLLEKIQAKTGDHATQREKGTGLLEVSTGGKTESVLLKWRSESQQEVEGLLKEWLAP
jgi:hypothetical protein